MGVRWSEFDPEVQNQNQGAHLIHHIVHSPSAFKALGNGRAAWWDDASGTVVIFDPKNRDLGTAFRPSGGRDYFDNRLK